MAQAIDLEQRRQAADRLMVHLRQKGRPAPYKERLIGLLADPTAENMPATLVPAAGKTEIGVLGQLVLMVEAWIRRVSHAEPQRESVPADHGTATTSSVT